ncbi:MAG: hypothetical protein WC683_02150 [bacterium]
MTEKKKAVVETADLDRAARLPDEYPEAPPAGYTDQQDGADVQASKEALLAGVLLGKLSKGDVDVLYKVLAPLSKKMGWYASRYWAMQDKISWYKNENTRLLKKCREYEQRFNISAEAREREPGK